MFPFRGMPVWAQWLGEALPVTHFLRVVRGALLKGAGLGDSGRAGALGRSCSSSRARHQPLPITLDWPAKGAP